MKEMLDVIKKTQKVGHLTPKEKSAVDTTVGELDKQFAWFKVISWTKEGLRHIATIGKSKTFFLYFQLIFFATNGSFSESLVKFYGITKGYKISKAIYGILDSSKKRKENLRSDFFCWFLGRIEDTIICLIGIF